MARKRTHWEATGQFSVLSVDDDSVNLMVVENLLPQDWKIVSAQDSEEALAALEEETWPDFIFLDYQMASDLNGDEICRRMRQVFGGAPIPIVMCTAMTAGSQALQDCKDAGATDFLLKPYERTRMLEKINAYCADKVQASRPPTVVAAAAAPPPPPAPAAPAPARAAPPPPAPPPEPSAMEEEPAAPPPRAVQAAPAAAPPQAPPSEPEPMDVVVMAPSAHLPATLAPAGWPSPAAVHAAPPPLAAPAPAPVLQPPALQPPVAPPQQQAPLPQRTTAAAPLARPPPPPPHADLFTFFVRLDLEVVGKKLVDAGLTLEQLRAMDDVTLRRAGVVVKSQRDKVLQALQAL